MDVLLVQSRHGPVAPGEDAYAARGTTSVVLRMDRSSNGLPNNSPASLAPNNLTAAGFEISENAILIDVNGVRRRVHQHRLALLAPRIAVRRARARQVTSGNTVPFPESAVSRTTWLEKTGPGTPLRISAVPGRQRSPVRSSAVWPAGPPRHGGGMMRSSSLWPWPLLAIAVKDLARLSQ